MSEVNISGEGRVSGGDTARRRLRELTSLTGVSTHSPSLLALQLGADMSFRAFTASAAFFSLL